MIKPSVDLGYPTEAQGDLPAFREVEEEAAFWDTHSVTDPSEITEMDEEFADPAIAAPLVVSLNQAEVRGIGASTLAGILLAERLH